MFFVLQEPYLTAPWLLLVPRKLYGKFKTLWFFGGFLFYN